MSVLCKLIFAACILQIVFADDVNQLQAPAVRQLATKNKCLNKPQDRYRTCFARAIDPSNNLKDDTILRDEYNMTAIKLLKSSKSGKSRRELGKSSKKPKKAKKSKSGKSGKSGKGSKSAKISVQPYTPPYITADEELTEGSIYLSMVKEEAEKRMSCDGKIELEEVTIEWLHVSMHC